MKSANWSDAEKHLSRDPLLRPIIRRVGSCGLKPRRDYFVLLCRAIYSQQISAKVARVLFARFSNCFPRRKPTPQRVLQLLTSDGEQLKSCGLSRQKRQYLIDLSNHFLDGRIPRNLGTLEDEQIIEALTAVNGIGRWTAEMFLIFTLNRPDVFSVGDFGIRSAMMKIHGLKKTKRKPTIAQLVELAEKWRPHRTAASWYLWRSLENLPVDEPKTKKTKKK
jgi:DNA-3-methyladenine glycosylase II